MQNWCQKLKALETQRLGEDKAKERATEAVGIPHKTGKQRATKETKANRGKEREKEDESPLGTGLQAPTSGRTRRKSRGTKESD
jgi:hypothetical protein